MLKGTPNNSIPQYVKRLAKTRQTPFLAIEKRGIQHKFEQFHQAMPHARFFYAVKTNSHKKIVKLMQSWGSGFEVSSEQELELLFSCGVSPDRIITSNPLKSISFIKFAYASGVKHFAFDSHEEIVKLAKHAPGSHVYVRLTVSNEGSQWPLSRKFGVETEQAAELLVHAAEKSLIPYGITFHVGSQCTEEASWVSAIEKSRTVWDVVQNKGIRLEMLNIGGGFPIEYTDSTPSIDRISSVIEKTLKKELLDNVEIFVEPGRALVGESGIMVSTVIAKARRNRENWLSIDVGVFNGFMESIGGIQYSIITEKEGPLQNWVLAGPSCDSMGVISNEVKLPDLEIGDIVYILSSGAYTTAYASRFNGFPIPKTYFY